MSGRHFRRLCVRYQEDGIVGLRDRRIARYRRGARRSAKRAEPLLTIMPSGNQGFDLVETNSSDEVERWIEVKAMAGALAERPVGLSKFQFDFAREHGEQCGGVSLSLKFLGCKFQLRQGRPHCCTCGWSSDGHAKPRADGALSDGKASCARPPTLHHGCLESISTNRIRQGCVPRLIQA
jgi:hypothetical protein